MRNNTQVDALSRRSNTATASGIKYLPYHPPGELRHYFFGSHREAPLALRRTLRDVRRMPQRAQEIYQLCSCVFPRFSNMHVHTFLGSEPAYGEAASFSKEAKSDPDSATPSRLYIVLGEKTSQHNKVKLTARTEGRGGSVHTE